MLFNYANKVDFCNYGLSDFVHNSAPIIDETLERIFQERQ